MAMRITTKMMQNTSLRNLNVNKQHQERLTNQMATGKKITRPSDDPVTAIRALKLNASLDKIDQYYERNAKDARSWLDLTDKAIDTVAKILSNDSGMSQLINQAANDYNENKDITAIVKDLVSLAEEYYSVGNADSAGRSLFTGYRTDLPLTFIADKTETYKIREQFTNLDMDKMTFVGTGCLKELNEGNCVSKDPADPTNTKYLMDTTEYDVTTNDVYRFRLAYNNLDGGTAGKATDDKHGTTHVPVITFEYGTFDGKTGDPANTVYSTDTTIAGAKPIQVFEAADEKAYMAAINDPTAVVYIASTGELLLGSEVKQTVSELPHDTEIRVSYEKSNWKKGDIDPVHYFYAEREHDIQKRWLEYNENFLKDPTASGKQIIEYDVGSNQTIRVNTTADELFTHDIGRDIDELSRMVEDSTTIQANLKVIEGLIESGKYEGDELNRLELEQAALKKADTYCHDKVKKRLGELLTNFSGYLENVNNATTNCGSRGSCLTLIENRLATSQTNYKELVSENEDADYAELTVQLSSVKMTYEAALSSISYVMQTSLLDYIR